ncbi:unnamed protein product [Citrullus colocynthis]|uniref:Uncharacterized protein n=1 Tax=Citrullus colocynthis TaxID=252529 RepID=A0ABP0Z6T3_9ROSI
MEENERKSEAETKFDGIFGIHIPIILPQFFFHSFSSFSGDSLHSLPSSINLSIRIHFVLNLIILITRLRS